jgi:hypothetical protein
MAKGEICKKPLRRNGLLYAEAVLGVAKGLRSKLWRSKEWTIISRHILNTIYDLW